MKHLNINQLRDDLAALQALLDKFVTKDSFDALASSLNELRDQFSKLEIDISSLKEIVSS
jgi:hypothetical protein